MADIPWPSAVKIVDMHIGVASPSRGQFGAINKYARFSATLTEVWSGQVALAAVSEDNKRALELFLARLQGRLNTFNLPIPAAHWAGANTGGSLLTETVVGANSIDLSGGGGARAGDIITVTSGSDVQTLECLNTSVRPRVAPRLRFAFPVGATFAAAASIPVRLAADEAGRVETVLQHGVCTLSVVEAV